MAPGGVETSVFHNTIVPESAHVDFSFGTLGMRVFKLILLDKHGSTSFRKIIFKECRHEEDRLLQESVYRSETP